MRVSVNTCKRVECVSEQERRKGVCVYVRECNRVCEDGRSVCACKGDIVSECVCVRERG